MSIGEKKNRTTFVGIPLRPPSSPGEALARFEHNFGVIDACFNLELMTSAIFAWFSFFPGRTCADVERYMRHKNFFTTLKPIHTIPCVGYSIGPLPGLRMMDPTSWFELTLGPERSSVVDEAKCKELETSGVLYMNLGERGSRCPHFVSVSMPEDLVSKIRNSTILLSFTSY